MIFTKACGAGVWTGNKRHLGTKTGWKVKEAVESGTWEGWKHNRNCIGRMTSKPPSAKRRSCHACHGANCAPRPGPAKPRGGPGRRAVCHQAGKVSRGIGDNRRVRPPGPLQWPSWSCLPLPLKRPTQWFLGLSQTHNYADEGILEDTVLSWPKGHNTNSPHVASIIINIFTVIYFFSPTPFLFSGLLNILKQILDASILNPRSINTSINLSFPSFVS